MTSLRVRHPSPSRIGLVSLIVASAGACVLPGADLVSGGGGSSSSNVATSTSSTGSGGDPSGTTSTGTPDGGGGSGSTTHGSTGGGGDAAGGQGGQGGDGAGGQGAAGGQGGQGGDGAGGQGGAATSTGTGGDGGGGPLAQPIALDAGLGHACLLRDDGAIYCWGRNDSGQVGFPTDPRREAWSAGEVEGLTGPAIDVALGDRHTCATLLLGDETRIRCWGEDADGQTGGNGAQQPTKIEYSNGIDVEGVAELGGGWRFGCARLEDGDVVCWGDGSQGALGSGTSDNDNAVLVVLPGDAVSLATSPTASRACAVLVGGALHCWGDGQPVEAVPVAANVQAAAVGTVGSAPPSGSELVGVIEDGGVRWTRRDAGGWAPLVELGEFGEDVAPARQVAIGQHEICVVTDDDALYCAPYDVAGDPDEAALAPVDAAGSVAEVALGTTSSGDGFRCVRRPDGATQCRGSNADGSIGNATPLYEPLPFPVGAVADVRAMTASSSATFAAEGDGATGRAWGTSTVLGVVDAIVPAPSLIPDGTTRLDFGRSAGDEAYVWGTTTGFHLRVDGGVDDTSRLPTLPYAFVEGKGATVRDIGRTDTGGVVTLCRSSSCNSYGAMGNGTQVSTVGASVLLSLGSFTADEVLAYQTASHHCARGTDGGAAKLLCWGRSNLGQVGNGSTTFVPTPTAIFDQDVVDACIGATRSCAVVGAPGARDVRCWGRAAGGGAAVDTSTPLTIPGTAGAAAIACGFEFTCAALEDGTVQCWGENDEGQLGDGTLVPHPTPAPVLGLDDVVDVTAGSRHACAIHESGAVSCWGANDHGQVGAGVPIFYDAPVDVVIGDGS